MRYLSLDEVRTLHELVVSQAGGSPGIRELPALESAVAQPGMTFGGRELYPTIVSKTAALGFSLIQNHPFVDGNKRVGHAAMETFLLLNGMEFSANVDEQERMILAVAAGEMSRDELARWIERHVTPSPGQAD